MQGLDEETALSIIFANTKRKKRQVDLLTVAENFEFLVGLYGSQKAVAERVGLHPEMVREFRSLLKLPEQVKALIRSRQIDRLDVAYKISMLGDEARQTAAAKAVAGMRLSKDVRDLVRLARDASLPIEGSKRMVLESKPKGLHLFVIDFDDEAYHAIIEEANAQELEAAELVREVVMDWLEQRGRIQGKEGV